jgi:hypothetical protein
MQMREMRFTIPEHLAKRLDEMAKTCGVDPVNVICVAITMITDYGADDERLELLKARAPLLKSETIN